MGVTPQIFQYNCKSFLSFCLRKVILDSFRLIQMEANPNIAD